MKFYYSQDYGKLFSKLKILLNSFFNIISIFSLKLMQLHILCLIMFHL